MISNFLEPYLSSVTIILPKTATKWSKVFADENIDEYVALNYFKKIKFIKNDKRSNSEIFRMKYDN